MLFTAAAFMGVLASSVAESTDGVAESSQHLYKITSGLFTCLDGKQQIPGNYVNDEYCDCNDGSDEPGTSACANSIFFCKNEGHEQLEIPSYRVNDGVCDCCDATDEKATGACADTCLEAGREWREEQELVKAMQAEGYATRVANTKVFATLKVDSAAKLAELEPEKETVAAEVHELRENQKTADEPANAAKDLENKEWDELLEQRRKDSKQAIFDLIDADEDSVITPAEYMLRVEFDTDEDGVVSQEEADEVFDQDQDSLVNETEGVMDFERFENDLYEDKKDLFHEIVHSVDDNKPEYTEATNALVEAAQHARDALNGREPRLRELNTEIDNIKAKLERDYGDDGSWAPYDGECFSAISAEYKYIICPYGEAKQEPANGGSSTSLGKFKGFEGPEGDKYTKLVFEGGQKCWNGPSRSITLNVKCGKEPELSSLNEPSKCEYVGTFRIPSMCGPPAPEHDEF